MDTQMQYTARLTSKEIDTLRTSLIVRTKVLNDMAMHEGMAPEDIEDIAHMVADMSILFDKLGKIPQ